MLKNRLRIISQSCLKMAETIDFNPELVAPDQFAPDQLLFDTQFEGAATPD